MRPEAQSGSQAASARARRPAWWGGLLLAAISFGLTLPALEWFARRLERARVQAKLAGPGLALMRENPSGAGSFRLRPGLDLDLRVKGVAVRIRTNSAGMAWREVALEKPARLRRVAFLGDSFTFGCWARDAQHGFVGVFESGLNARRFEVLNFGVGGYGLDDEELLLREVALAYDPDWVFVMTFVGNDFRDTWLGLNKHRLEAGTARLRDERLAERVPATFIDAPWPPAQPAHDPNPLRRWLTDSATFRLLQPRLGLTYPWVQFAPSRRFTSFPFWSQRPAPPVALRARDEYLATLGRLRDLVHARGARLAVVTIPFREQVYASEPSGPGWDITYPQAWVAAWADTEDVPFLDLLPRLREHALRTNDELYVEDDIHWNEQGHALAGTWLRDWFQQQLLPTTRAKEPNPQPQP